MASVLGQLFADIASAIREKTNETGKIKPSEFPEKIKNMDSSIDTYNLGLAEMLMTRNAGHFNYDDSDIYKLSLRGFKMSGGSTLGSLSPYSFAGFQQLKGIRVTDVMYISENTFAGDEALKIIDITVPDVVDGCVFVNKQTIDTNTWETIELNEGALTGCVSLESIIVRGGEKGLKIVTFRPKSAYGSSNNFYVYVPTKYYDTVISNIPSNSPVSKSRYRKLEDYPEIDNWYDSY